MMHTIRILLIIVILFLSSGPISSQSRYTDSSGQINFSNLDHWYFRQVKQSFILGGENIKLYQIGEMNGGDSISNLKARSPWGTSNLQAKLGVDIAAPCVFPESRNGGYCARLETRVQGIHVLGLTIDALVTGAIFLGNFIEPFRSIKSPVKKMNHGIPFTKCPKGVRFDYKCSPGDTRINTEKHGSPVQGKDMAEFCIILQKRWEEPDGSVSAIRIGGIRAFLKSTGNQWINGATYQIRYGDLTREPYYDAATMGLIPSVGPMYVTNSKGDMVPLVERGWGKEGDTPTHLVMYFSSSYQGIDFIGSPESKFWVDNISLTYQE